MQNACKGIKKVGKFEGRKVVKKSYFCTFFSMDMRMRFYAYLCVMLMPLLLLSCSKDFNSNAPYRDATIVYGILDASDDVQYIKIYKGFLTDGNAYEAAQIYDSLYYFDKITVDLEEYFKGRKINTWRLDTTTAIPRDLNGDLSAPKQLLYVVNHPVNPENIYKLVITNKETGRVVTAETNVVGETMITSPSTQELNITNATSNSIKWNDASNASAYIIMQTFNYLERDKTTGVTTLKSLHRTVTPSPITSNSFQYVPSALYDFICTSIEVDNTVDRYLIVDSCVCLELWAVNDTYYNYVRTSSITSSVVMDHLVYTNVACEDDDLVAGFFGSRQSAYKNYRLNPNSQKLIVEGVNSKKLNFHYFYELPE